MLRSLLFVALFLALAGTANAAPVTVAWDANPPEEQVTKYQVKEGTTLLWEGPETQTTVELQPGVHTLNAYACNVWGCSEPSLPVGTPPGATAPRNIVINITINIP